MSSSESLPSGLTVRSFLAPGDVETLVRMHGEIYADEYGWDSSFAAYVAEPLSAFAGRSEPCERIWIVEREGRLAGCVAIVEAPDGWAQLRWLLVHPSARGQGIGSYLVGQAVRFAREQGYGGIQLWTVSLLASAASLYCAAGFVLTEERTHRLWGAILTEQRYDLVF